MPAPFRPSFWEELRQRRVVRAVSVYAVVAWVAVQVADVFFPALRLPDWSITLVAALALLGFPVTVAVAWIFERTPEGLRRTGIADGGGGHAGALGEGRSGVDRRFVFALGLGAIAGVVVVGAVLWLAGWVRGLGGDPAGEGPAVVAVLPFETVGQANATFTEGIHGDILTRLSGLSGLDVIARGSVLGYRGTERPASEIGEALAAGWILRGEVQQVGDQVRVHARLVDARRDRQIWAEAYRRELTAANLFDIQREITRQIADALETRLTPRERAAAAQRDTDDLEAYRLYVQGRGLLSAREEVPMRRALEYFQRAIARDSSYAAAWAALADALTYLETFGYPTPPGAVAPEEAARRALALEPGLAEAHFALANLAHARRDNGEAVRRARQAIELRPSYPDAFNLLSWIYKQHGLPADALDSAERAVELDPLGPAMLSNLALAHLALGDPAEAARQARRIQDIRPDFTTGRFLEALALYHQGRFADARPLLEGLSVAWAEDAALATLALTRVALGDTAAARATVTRLDPERHPFSVALIRAALADAGKPLETIVGIEQWAYWPTFAVRYFFPDVLAPLRSDPRYPSVLQQVDRSWGWDPELWDGEAE